MNERYDADRHHRRSIRRRGWDYRLPGAYFITICAHERMHLFEHEVYRDVVANAWQAIPSHAHAQHVLLDECVVMPNHIHGIIIIEADPIVGARQAGRTVEEQNQPAIRPASPISQAGDHVESRDQSAIRRSTSVVDVAGDSGGTGATEGRARQVGMDVEGEHERVSRPASPLHDGRALPNGAQPGSIGAIVGNFKSLTARRINQLRRMPGAKVWQRGYYDRIVRNERELNAIRRYIRDNPRRWAEDRENLERLTARMRMVG